MLRFTVATQAGLSYTLESTTSLSSWKSEQSIIAQGSTTVFEIFPSENRLFFRVRRD
jgi:hypothetical protein